MKDQAVVQKIKHVILSSYIEKRINRELRHRPRIKKHNHLHKQQHASSSQYSDLKSPPKGQAERKAFRL